MDRNSSFVFQKVGTFVKEVIYYCFTTEVFSCASLWSVRRRSRHGGSWLHLERFADDVHSVLKGGHRDEVVRF